MVRTDLEVEAAELDSLAKDLDVELKDGMWDFGEVVMRGR